MMSVTLFDDEVKQTFQLSKRFLACCNCATLSHPESMFSNVVEKKSLQTL
jgi:hypothetical protein